MTDVSLRWPEAPDTRLLEALADMGTHRRYRRGALLIQEGDTGDALFIVRQGRLRVYLADDSAKELTLRTCGPLDYVGEMSLDGSPRSANVEALETSTCSVVSRVTLLNYMAQHPGFTLDMITRLISTARNATESARSVALVDVYGRLVRLLDRMASPPDELGERVLYERLTHQAIARHLACSREMVSRLLKDLEVGGYVAVRQQRLRLLKRLPARW